MYLFLTGVKQSCFVNFNRIKQWFRPVYMTIKLFQLAAINGIQWQLVSFSLFLWFLVVITKELFKTYQQIYKFLT